MRLLKTNWGLLYMLSLLYFYLMLRYLRQGFIIRRDGKGNRTAKKLWFLLFISVVMSFFRLQMQLIPNVAKQELGCPIYGG